MNEQIVSYPDTFTYMLAQYSKFSLLTSEEEKELWKKILYTTNINVIELLLKEKLWLEVSLGWKLEKYFIFSIKENKEIIWFLKPFTELILDSAENQGIELSIQDIFNFISTKIIWRTISPDYIREIHINKLMNSNLRLVISIAKKYFWKISKHISKEDLVNQWTLWLHEAVLRFDYKKWFKFSTYATWWIKQVIWRYIKDNNRTIRVSSSVIDDLQKVLDAKSTLSKDSKNPNDIEAIAELLWITTKDVDKLLSLPNAVWWTVISADWEEDSLIDMYSNQDWMDSDVEREINTSILSFNSPFFEEILSCLTDREKDVIIKRYVLELNLEETAKALVDGEVTRERVRQIQLKAERKMRQRMILLKSIPQASNLSFNLDL